MSGIVGRSLLLVRASQSVPNLFSKGIPKSRSSLRIPIVSDHNRLAILQRFNSSTPTKQNNDADYIDKNSEIQKLLRELYPDSEEVGDTSKQSTLPGNLAQQNLKYFDADESTIIYDIDEERLRDTIPEKKIIKNAEKFKGIDLSHGVEGVIDIDVMVDILRRENCADICVVTVPPENNYSKYVVVTTCRSARHLIGVSDLIRKVYKLKAGRESTYVPYFDGRAQPESGWIAADLGNMVLHLFLQTSREKYDIESLWALGSEYDELCQPTNEEFEHYRRPLEDLVPAE